MPRSTTRLPRRLPRWEVLALVALTIAAFAGFLLYDRRHAVLINEEVVRRPAAGSALLLGNRRFAFDEQPALSGVLADIVTGEHLGMLSDELRDEVK